MIRLTGRMPAPPDTVFAPDAFAAQIGMRSSLKLTLHGTNWAVDGVLVDATVVDGGHAVMLTVEDHESGD